MKKLYIILFFIFLYQNIMVNNIKAENINISNDIINRTISDTMSQNLLKHGLDSINMSDLFKDKLELLPYLNIYYYTCWDTYIKIHSSSSNYIFENYKEEIIKFQAFDLYYLYLIDCDFIILNKNYKKCYNIYDKNKNHNKK